MKLSIIIPIYNVDKYLDRAISSVLNQSKKNLEIILINDGSSDNSLEIIKNYQNKDPRVVVISKDNKGYGHTVNAGLAVATGDYVAIMEPDDYIDKEMYKDLCKLAERYNADVIKSGYYEHIQTQEFNEDKQIKWRNDIPEETPFLLKDFPYFLSFHPSIWTCIYKKSFLKDNEIRVVEAPGSGWTDNLFQVQTLCLAKSIIYTSKAYYHWSRFASNPSLELNDFKIPFIRTKEIHDWLRANKIEDHNILAALYRRELAYIRIVKEMTLSPSDYKKACNLIKNMCFEIDSSIFLNNSQVKEKEKEDFILYLSLS